MPKKDNKTMEKLVDLKYNKLKKEFNNKINLKENYEFVFNDSDKIVELYLDDKIKLKAEYNTVGLYNIPMSIWYWGWNIQFINKDYLTETNKIKNYDHGSIDSSELYYFLSNDNFYCSSQNIDKIIKLSLYITNGLWCFPVKNTDDNLERIHYILITKIIQYY